MRRTIDDGAARIRRTLVSMWRGHWNRSVADVVVGERGTAIERAAGGPRRGRLGSGRVMRGAKRGRSMCEAPIRHWGLTAYFFL